MASPRSCPSDAEELLPVQEKCSPLKQETETETDTVVEKKVAAAEPMFWVECGCLHKVRCVTADMVPDCMQEAYISTGYRPFGLDWVTITHTLFQMHNETFNIWTHLLGFFLLLVFTINAAHLEPNAINPRSKVPLMLFLVSLLNSLMGSFLFHWYHCKSFPVFNFFRNMDYSAIPLLIACSLMAMMQYTFNGPDHVLKRSVYTTAIAILGLGGVLCCYVSALQTKEFRVFRSLLFAGIALCGLLPLIHMGFIHGFDNKDYLGVLGSMAVPVSLYTVGMGLYVSHAPERFCPNFVLFSRYHFGYSHTLFHCFVIAGGVTTYLAIVDFWQRPPFMSPVVL